jgi:hypothetical protein
MGTLYYMLNFSKTVVTGGIVTSEINHIEKGKGTMFSCGSLKSEFHRTVLTRD